jgi:hypothetical protein
MIIYGPLSAAMAGKADRTGPEPERGGFGAAPLFVRRVPDGLSPPLTGRRQVRIDDYSLLAPAEPLADA